MFGFFKKRSKNKQLLAIEEVAPIEEVEQTYPEEQENNSKNRYFDVRRQEEYQKQQEQKAELLRKWGKLHGIQMTEEVLRKKYRFIKKPENKVIQAKENLEHGQEEDRKKIEDQQVIEMERERRLQTLINEGILETSIGKVRYYDEEANSHNPSLYWRSSTLFLTIYRLTLTFDDGGSVELKITDNYLYTVEIEGSNNDIYSLYDENNIWIVSFSCDNKAENSHPEMFIEHFELLNKAKPFRDEANRIKNEEFAQHSKEVVEKLLHNEEVTIFLDGYLEKTEQVYFLDPDFFIAFEKYLEHGKEMLEYDLDEYEWPESVELESVEAYYQDSFSLFVKLLSSKNFFGPLQDGDLLTWLLLKKRAVTVYSKYFNDEYGNHFSKLNENNSPHDYVLTYKRIETVNIESVVDASLLTYYFMKKTNASDESYLVSYQDIKNEILQAINDKQLKDFELSLLETSERNKDKITINDIDMMDGHEFEHFIAKLFRKMGYSTEVTKGSGDQGIDVIATKDGRKFGIQTKCYSSTVTNKAIQEVAAGIKHYKLDKGMVVTNNFFTDSAQKLANSNGVILWSRTILNEKIKEFL